MPWDESNPPAPAKGRSAEEIRACVGAANSVLDATGDEGAAIAACSVAMDHVGMSAGKPTEFSLLSGDTAFDFAWSPDGGLTVARQFDLGTPPAGTVELYGVEIFRVGTWNDTKFTARDLDDMIAAFDKVGFRPPVKLGHDFATGTPAYGWVEAIRRDGDVLIADLTAVPSDLADMIRQRRYDTVSAEVYFDLERGGAKFRRVLAGIAVLGGEIPAVSDLKPLHKSLSIDAAKAGRAATFTITRKETPAMADDPNKGKDKAPDAGLAALQAKITALESQNADLVKTLGDQSKVIAGFSGVQATIDELKKSAAASQETARQARIKATADTLQIPSLRQFVATMLDLATKDTEPKLVTYTVDGKETKITPEAVIEQFISAANRVFEPMLRPLTRSGPTARDVAAQAERPSVEVDKRVAKYRADHANTTYEAALGAVLAADPELKARYAQQYN